ncbi:MAG: hypothetical protein HKL91_04665 [Candidatus Eremiobacteraeota bacterium]|uniref:Uncharacterized protein n=1 Tax=mine drainage metagenome TaxID=410659 RepID=E6PE52_9ZZZZ|nr:hypothetical protein [Candidatus Eremiobacteraeota bacterium]
MRRLLLSMLALCALPALAAPRGATGAVVVKATAAPKIAPTIVPKTAPTGTPLPSGPKVIVYPFTATSSGLPKHAGATVATIFAHAFEASGGLDVLPSPPPTASKLYPATAAKLGAGYYVAGYLTPIGQGVSVLEQVVSVTNGVIIYSKTAQVFSVSDAGALALDARSAILADAGVGRDYQPSSSSQTPAPTATGPAGQAASIKISGISGVLGHIFGKRPTVAAAASPTPEPKPSRRALVVRVAGKVPGGMLTTSTDLLAADLRKHFHASIVAAPSGPMATAANAICGTDRDATILTGTIDLIPGHFMHRGSSRFYLKAYACFGALLYHGHADAGDTPTAIRKAVDDYVELHPDNH